MCTLFIHRKKNSDWPILIAANRDEYYSRSFKKPGKHWKKYPSIFAGKDSSKGGSWLGLNKKGLCAAILNRDSTNIVNKKNTSRGNVVINMLKYNSAKEALKSISKTFNFNTKYFNLFIADYKNAYWIKYLDQHLTISKIPFGFSILDNYDLNDQNSLKQKLYFKIFIKKKLPNPNKKSFKDWQDLLFLNKKYKNVKLSSVFIDNFNNNYGTVCSSIIGLPNRTFNKQNMIWLYSEYKNPFLKLLPFKD